MEKNNSGMPVNDGKGLYDSEGLCDLLIIDCNNAVKSIFTGNYIAFCSVMAQMVQKLTKLKDGINADLASKDEIIEELKHVNNALVEEKTGLPVEGG